jgi:hypothetical protein
VRGFADDKRLFATRSALLPRDIAAVVAARLGGRDAADARRAPLVAAAAAAGVAAVAGRGAAAPGRPPPPVSASGTRVVWVDGGDEVVVHLDSVKAQIAAGSLLVAVDLEADQTGRQTLVVALALGSAADPAGLVAVTDDLPRGNGLLAARWGGPLQAAVWGALVDLAQQRAAADGTFARGFALGRAALDILVGPPPKKRGKTERDKGEKGRDTGGDNGRDKGGKQRRRKRDERRAGR